MPYASAPVSRRLALPIDRLLQSLTQMVWPSQDADESLDYTLDATAWLAASAGDTIVQFEVDPIAGDGLLDITRVGWTPQIATYWLSGGTPNGWYTIAALITTANKRRAELQHRIKIGPGIAQPILPASAVTLNGSSLTLNGYPITISGYPFSQG